MSNSDDHDNSPTSQSKDQASEPAKARKSNLLFDILGHNLVVGLIIFILGAAAMWLQTGATGRAERRASQIQLAGDIERWLSRYASAIAKSANLGATYGDPVALQAAMDTLSNLILDVNSSLSVRATQVGSLFGSEALGAYLGIGTSSQNLRHCFDLVDFRRATYGIEDPLSKAVAELREQCSRALQEFDSSRTRLLSTMGAVMGSSVPVIPIEWVRAELKVDGTDGPVILGEGQTFSVSWAAPDALVCKFEFPSDSSGISPVGVSALVTTDHPWYPKSGSQNVLRFICTNLWVNGSDSVIVLRH